MQNDLIGKWVEVTLINDKKWIGVLEEWDEEALFISNGNKFGAPDHKGAECASDEVSKVNETSEREFTIA
ncbi:MAG: hypothetical protein ACPGJV_13940 [Bacteriovoracaceae bacterium]